MNYKKANTFQKLQLIKGLSYKRSKDGQLSVPRQYLEMLMLFIWRGQGPGYYHTAGFWRNNIPWKDKLAHMNMREYRSIVNDYNPPGYQKTSQNKVIEKAVLNLCKIPRNEFIGFLNKSSGFDLNGKTLTTPADFFALISQNTWDKICFKPVESWGGQGFLAFSIFKNNDDVFFERIDNKKMLTIEELYSDLLNIENGESRVIEAYLEQHGWYAKLNPSSVNSFRLWVVKNDNNAQTKLGYLRIGRAGSLVDNQSSGGIVAHVDLNTGELDAAIDGLPTRESWTHHPDTGVLIKGQKPPYFEECMKLAEKSLMCFQGINFAGVDVAVGPDGPVIVELNVNPDREGAAFTDIPTKEIFL